MNPRLYERRAAIGRAVSWLAAAAMALALGSCQDKPMAAKPANYEVWALDQGTDAVYIYDAQLNQVARVDLAAHGVKNPHMVDFTSDGAYAFIASTGSGDVTVIRTADRKVLSVIKTGPGTHMAGVSPGDKSVIADVIGDPKVPKDGKLVEIVIDKETFKLGRTLVVADDPAVKARAAKFSDTNPICHKTTADGKFAYVTLGPGLKDGGLVILDMATFAFAKVYPVDELKVNCGTMPLPDKKHMLVNGGDGATGVWFVLDTTTHAVVKSGESRGKDAHGVWVTPNGREIWMVNRVTSNGIVMDARTFEITGDLAAVGPTPDIIAMSPDGKFAFITTRGPNPVSAAHLAKGTTPGFAVVGIADRKLIRIVQPDAANPKSDLHGIGVRVIAN